MFGIIFLQVILAILILFGLVFLYSWFKYKAPEVAEIVKISVQIISIIILLALLLTYAICQALETKQRNISSGEEYNIQELLGGGKWK